MTAPFDVRKRASRESAALVRAPDDNRTSRRRRQSAGCASVCRFGMTNRSNAMASTVGSSPIAHSLGLSLVVMFTHKHVGFFRRPIRWGKSAESRWPDWTAIFLCTRVYIYMVRPLGSAHGPTARWTTRTVAYVLRIRPEGSVVCSVHMRAGIVVFKTERGRGERTRRRIPGGTGAGGRVGRERWGFRGERGETKMGLNNCTAL